MLIYIEVAKTKIQSTIFASRQPEIGICLKRPTNEKKLDFLKNDWIFAETFWQFSMQSTKRVNFSDFPTV